MIVGLSKHGAILSNSGGAVNREFLPVFRRSWPSTPAGFADAETQTRQLECESRRLGCGARGPMAVARQTPPAAKSASVMARTDVRGYEVLILPYLRPALFATHPSASARTSAMCLGRKGARWLIWWRQLVPEATTTVPKGWLRTFRASCLLYTSDAADE